MRWLLARTTTALLIAALLGGTPTASGQQIRPAPQAIVYEDFSIPNGYFFTQAAPGQNGRGYRVADEGGIPFWYEFNRVGGLAKLGYPVSRRFIWKDRVVQLFQFGALRWLGEDQGTDIVNPRAVGAPPRSASLTEAPPFAFGDAEVYPWSGWWWPANNQVAGPRLFDPDGPLSKFDSYAQTLGLGNPRTREWEQSELVFPALQWAGHCNGWAAASLIEPEPKETRIVNGIPFSVADQKGLLTSFHFADSALWALGSEGAEISPADFHKALRSWLGTQRKGMVFTFHLGGEEVWSYAAFKYETVVGPDAFRPDVWHARTIVWLVDNEVPPGFVGGRPWPSAEGKLFEYTLVGDPENPTGGEWGPNYRSRFGRPFMVWYPDPTRRNVDRQLASPGLDYDLIRQIVAGT